MRLPNWWPAPATISSGATVPASSLRKRKGQPDLRKSRWRSRRAAASTPRWKRRCHRHPCKIPQRGGTSRQEPFHGIRRDNQFHVRRVTSRRSGSTMARNRPARRQGRKLPQEVVGARWLDLSLTWSRRARQTRGHFNDSWEIHTSKSFVFKRV